MTGSFMIRISFRQALRAVGLPLLILATAMPGPVAAQGRDGFDRPERSDLPTIQAPDTYRPDPYRGGTPAPSSTSRQPGGYYGSGSRARPNDAYVPPPQTQSAWPTPPPADRDPNGAPAWSPGPQRDYRADERADYRNPPGGYGTPYEPPRDGVADDGVPPRNGQGSDPRQWDERRGDGTYSRNEVLDAGHRFFGSISSGLAGAVEYVFQNAGRPNGYILGEDAGGAFIAGLRYGEGTLYTKDAGNHRVYWQGPSLGYDFGGEGSKTMVLVYNLRDISEIYNRFGGIQGSAYLVGGVGVQFQKYGDVVLAPIRSGVGLRLGANVGYLKYTRTPTWNPF